MEPDGAWLRGDLHVHSSVGSNDTDGLGTPDVLGERMASAGLDFVFITDHSNSQGSMHCDDVEDCPNQGPELPAGSWPAGAYPASEISPRDPGTDPAGHVGCLPLAGADFAEPFVDRPMGAVTGGDAIAQCHDARGFAIVNHPHALLWLAFDWTSEAFDALEVFNGTLRFDRFDAATVEAWAARVAEGRDVVPTGGSDCHRWFTEPPGGGQDPALGHPTTSVFAHPSDHPLDAIVAGRVVVHDPMTDLAMRAVHGRRTALPGERIDGPAVVEVEASTTVEGLDLQILLADGTVLADRPLDGPVQTAVEVARGAVYARVWPRGTIETNHGGVALTNVIRVE